MNVLRIALTALCLALAACTPDTEAPAPESPAEEAAAPESTARHMLNEALKTFQPTAEETAFLDAAPAVNIHGQTNGYFTNQAGVAGYFSGYDQPFNFIWTGGVKPFTALDGRSYQIMDGPGTLLLKHMHDDLLMQKYVGGTAEGLWHGYGQYWRRNEDGDGHSYVYTGEFHRDAMEGRGVFVDYDFYLQDADPMEYRGEFKDGDFHGRGTATNLITGEVIFKGLWFLDEPLSEGGPSRWAASEERAELSEYGHRQYSSLIVVGPVEVDAVVNDPPGEGPLTVIVPEKTDGLEITGAGGRRFGVGLIRHPGQKTADGGDLYVTGFSEDIPLQDYPLDLCIRFRRGGPWEGVSLTVKRPFILDLR